MSAAFKIGAGRAPSNSFSTENGLVVYYGVISWECANQERGIIHPLCDQARAAWAVSVLAKHYPDRTYDTVKRYGAEGVDSACLESTEALVVADLTKLELAHRLGVDWRE